MLKRRSKVEAGFSMSSMTDIVFLLLLFFVMTATTTSPNDIKINLPQSRATTATKQVAAKVFIDENGNYSLAHGSGRAVAILPENLESEIMNIVAGDSLTYIALHADQTIQYGEVVRVLDIANQHKLKIVISTKTRK
ncbi:MAG: biopolymer transporter ExbD [Paludibacter sp.]|jgi:biopolymer transport protein ExbD|nr:biopolymer transporter ExbD [Paludibacter sp.]